VTVGYDQIRVPWLPPDLAYYINLMDLDVDHVAARCRALALGTRARGTAMRAQAWCSHRPIVTMRCLSRAVSGRRQERPRASWQPAQMRNCDAPKAQLAGASLTPARPRPARRSQLDW